MALYLATVLPGLEHVLAHEMSAKISDAEICGLRRGKVFVQSGQSAAVLATLRTADNLYRYIHRFEVGSHNAHVADIEREVSRLNMEQYVAQRKGAAISFKVNASRTGKHTYSRFDAAEAAMRGIVRRSRRFKPDMSGGHAVEFRLDIEHDEAMLSLRLTDASFRYRAGQREFVRAALRPTVAHALVWLSEPQERDTFIDPCCGSGTIVAERLAYPYCRIDGGDLCGGAVAAAMANIGSRQQARIRLWDARRLPLDAGYADKAATNLPFGRQVSAHERMDELYAGMFKELRRVLTSGGTVICLTDAHDALLRAAAAQQLESAQLASLSLKGLHPAVYKLRKP